MKSRFLSTALSAIFLLAGYPAEVSARDFSPSRKLQMAEAIVEAYYVDTVNADKLVEDAIISLLSGLDPHSQYSTPEETKALNEPLEGNFSGVGIHFNMVQDTLYVIQTIAGGPSEQVGIRAGDRIVAVDDTVVAGVKMLNTDIMKRLRGPKGTVVNVEVVRRSEPAPLRFRIVRDDIPLYTIDAAYMADPTTGYIRIARFGAETQTEFANAVNKLLKAGMKNLIIDLQDNSGGYLDAAVDVAGNFLKKRDLIVYTDGRTVAPQYFAADRDGDLRSQRVVVMTNEFSASASEILAGALQDHDRGVIVGRRTFGKGLVQRPFPFPDGSMMRLTVARYYTPSGRSIQKPYDLGGGKDYELDLQHRYEHGEFLSADSIRLNDSLLYTTLHSRRPVYGGGGIMPDRFVPLDTTTVNDYYRNLRAKNAFNNFVIDYVDRNREELKTLYPTEDIFMERFSLTPAMMDEFVSKSAGLGVEPDPEQLESSREFIEAVITGLLARDLFDSGSYYRVTNKLNPVYREALRIINSPDEYEKLLQ